MPETERTEDQPRDSYLYARIVQNIREAALTTTELAEVTGVGERQVFHWAKGNHRPEGVTRDHLLEVNYVVEALKEVYTAEGIDIWMHARNRSLDGQRPLDLLREGNFEAVLDAVERLRSGAM